MPNIDDAVEFFTTFFDAEFKVMEANLAGASSFTSRYAKMKKMLKEPHVHEINRWDPKELAKASAMKKRAMENTRKDLARRQLFVVEQHDISPRKKLFCAYASDRRVPESASMYAAKFWADSSLHVIGHHWCCADCHGLGTLKGSKCGDCGGRGWHRKTGDRELINLGKPSAVKKLLRPPWPQCAEHYDKL
jgi:hypothetical protein